MLSTRRFIKIEIYEDKEIKCGKTKDRFAPKTMEEQNEENQRKCFLD